MKTDLSLFIVFQFILQRGQTSVLDATKRASFAPTATEAATVDTSHQGCEYNGMQYNHTQRLPGCFKVYCIQGKWLQEGYIDWNCMFCSAYWDPHLVTFDGWYYDFQGPCEYALAQEGTSRTPRFAINTKFIECLGGASCVGPSTFKDSEKTLIEMGAFGWGAPDLFKLKVNGVLYEVPDSIPRLVQEGTQDHPVFAWRYNCIRLLGSSNIAVEKCGSSLAVWASPKFHGSLYGLCGFYDGNKANDFTKRDGTVSPLDEIPTDFPSSWEIRCPSDISRNVTKSAAEGESTNCTLDKKQEEELRNRCNETVGRTQGLLTEDMTAVLMENCFFDLCSIFKNTSGDSDVLKSWLGEIDSSITEISDSANKITGTDILPEPAKDNQPEPTTNRTGINSDLVKTVLTGSTKNLTNSSADILQEPAMDEKPESPTNKTEISSDSVTEVTPATTGLRRSFTGTDNLPEHVDDNEPKGTTKRTGISNDSVQTIVAVTTGPKKNLPDLRIDNSPNPVEDVKQDVMTNGTEISTDSAIPLAAVSPVPNRNLPDTVKDELPELVEDDLKPSTNRTGIPSDSYTPEASVSIRSDTYSDSSTDILTEPIWNEVDVMNNGTGISIDSLTPVATLLPGANRNLPDSNTFNSPKEVKHRKLGVTTDGTGISSDSLTSIATVLPGSKKDFPHSSRDALPDNVPVDDELEPTTRGTAIRFDLDIPDAGLSTGSNRNLPDSNEDNSPVHVEDEGPEITTDETEIGLITDSVEVVLIEPNKDLPVSNKPTSIWRIVIDIIHAWIRR